MWWDEGRARSGRVGSTPGRGEGAVLGSEDRATRRRPELLLHEVLFALLLVVLWLRFTWRFGGRSPDALLYLGLLATSAALIGWCALRPTALRWRLRCAFYPAALYAAYVQIGDALARLRAPLYDGLLARIDTLLVGVNPSVALQAWSHPLLTEFLSLCYMLFIPYLAFGLLWYWLKDVRLMKTFFSGVIGIYAVGLLGYAFLPAQGPFMAFVDRFQVPLTGGWLTSWNSSIVLLGSNHVDVFPSLHCAASSFILFFDRRHTRWRYRLFLVPVAGLWVSTLYLRYHYVVDILCGFALAALLFRAVGAARPPGSGGATTAAPRARAGS
jgi:hypothetical protein